MSAGLALLFSTILFTDLLCPEHRFWVQALGSIAVFGAVVTAIGLARGWASAAFLALPTTVCGVAIGLIDSVHAAERGSIVAVAFAVLSVGAAWLMWRQAQLFLWDRSVRRRLAAAPALPSEAREVTPEPAPQEAAESTLV
jgi:hypothetical protein